MRLLCAVTLVAALCLQARATVTLSITAADLLTSNQELAPVGSLVLLVASTTDVSFGPPRADYFVSGDDIVLRAWALQVPGQFSGLAANIPIFTDPNLLSPGDPLQLYWFPTLTLANYNSGFGPGEVEYGVYRHNAGLDGGSPWTIPADGSTVSLVFLTQSVNGSNPNDAGLANLTVAPVPEASNVIFGGLAVGLVAFRLVPRLRRKFATR